MAEGRHRTWFGGRGWLVRVSKTQNIRATWDQSNTFIPQSRVLRPREAKQLAQNTQPKPGCAAELALPLNQLAGLSPVPCFRAPSFPQNWQEGSQIESTPLVQAGVGILSGTGTGTPLLDA